MEILTKEQILTMREAGKVASEILNNLRSFIKPGISTKDIESFFDSELVHFSGMQSAFRGFSGYPASLCVSVNEEVIHGVPRATKIINDGDVVSVDIGITYQGLCVDTARTYIAGRASSSASRLVKTTYAALQEAIPKARVGAKIGDISSAIQQLVEKKGFQVIRRYVGHGIGTKLHCAPEVPNFGTRGEGEPLMEGMAIAIEPMVSAGSFEVDVSADGWTARTCDGSLSAHFEHTVAITKRGPIVITA